MNGPTLVANAEKLPGEVERVSARFLSWYYEDDAWSGLWSANPEGYIDSEDMHLSQTDLRLHLTPEQGRLGGEIAVRSICKAVPMLDYFLLEGTVSGDTATITAFDHIGGSRENFFRFTAKREGVVLTATLKEGDPEWLPSHYRIGLHPKVEGEDPYKLLSGFCGVEREALKEAIRKSKGEGNVKPSSQRTNFGGH